MATLNRESPLPLYVQLAEQVEARIKSGSYQTGTTIPSEHSLCDEFGVGRPTVRQATDELVRKGLLQRRRGAGTFVQRTVEAIDLFSLGGTIRSFEDRGLLLETEILAPAHLLVSSDGRSGFNITRLSRIKHEPILIEDFWFDSQVFPHFDDLELSGLSLSQVIQAKYGLRPLSADQTFSAVALAEQQAQLLCVAPHSAALLVDRLLHFSIAKNAVSVQMLCKQDARFTFAQTIGGYIA